MAIAALLLTIANVQCFSACIFSRCAPAAPACHHQGPQPDHGAACAHGHLALQPAPDTATQAGVVGVLQAIDADYAPASHRQFIVPVAGGLADPPVLSILPVLRI